MKLKLFEAEWYPVYCVEDLGYGREVEVSEEFWNQYQKVFAEFEQFQTELGEKWDESKAA